MKRDEGYDAEVERLDRVVIAAAVAAVLGGPASIRNIKPVPGRLQGAWMREGRLAIQRSHRTSDPLIGAGRPRKEVV